MYVAVSISPNATWPITSRHCRACRDVTWWAKWHLGYNSRVKIIGLNGGSRHPSATPVGNLRHQRRCPCTAPVLPVMSVSVRALWIKPFVNYSFGVWRSAGIGVGTTSVRPVHRWPHFTYRKSRSVTTPLRRLVSDVDRVERFRLTFRFFDDVSTASWFSFSIPTSNFSTTRRNFQSVISMLFLFSLKSSC